MDERFYHYYFEGIEKPVNILAANKQEARHQLQVMEQDGKLSAEYIGKSIVEEKNSYPLPGVTHYYDEQDNKIVWVGRSKQYPSGWKKEAPQ